MAHVLWILAVTWGLCGGAWGSSKDPDAVLISLRPEATVREHMVRLSDVARVDGAPEHLGAVLESLMVGVAPALCLETILHADGIRDRIRQVVADSRILMQGASTVRVSRGCVRIPDGELAEAGTRFIRDQMAWPQEQVEISDIRTTGVDLPEGPVSFQVTASPGEVFLGMVSLEIGLVSGGETLRRVRWRGRVSVFEPVVRAARGIGLNQVIGPEDVVLEAVDRAELRRPPVSALEEAVGNRATRRIASGSILTPSDLGPPLLVRRGEPVILVARSGALSVSARGVAQEGGTEGQWVRIRNSSSQKDVSGKVVALDTVEVEF